ncbi:uncharacterized protein LOC119772772 [Cyprinodon tularosa]|uniref:uncharacterized protein LOC119772772 n=1 Tax=Cyprinodon tularosa TaxID=77115 RepID=UPI0018E22B8C|nr:uncharacterized protein LOC119772772 [Cyprinodon tularosa]XP_038125323.1 uncharacterized protein LOC119772772 [Cyprinodon tularosa]XP_038125324.1 uncharacterized protein LOC119772772 [Cyprinodon tularosa]
MDGVLEGALVLSACKLACSLFFLPSLAATHSPVSFCCSSLLIFTDFLITGFLGFLWALKFWLTELNPPGDVIALRFLLFLSHTYGAVLLLTTFLISMETLIRVLWPDVAAVPSTVDDDGEEEEDSSQLDKGESLPQVVGFFCCLSVWIAVAFSVRWHWALEEGWTAACLDTDHSLVRCLPNLFSPMHSVINPHWSSAFLILLGLMLTISTGLQRSKRTSAEPNRTQAYWDSWWQALNKAMPASFKPVHPEGLMTKCADRDFVLTSHECLSEKGERQDTKRTQKQIPLPFIMEQHLDSNETSLSRWQLWVFSNLEEKTLMGFFSVLFFLTLPFYLSINILLIRTIDTLLQGCIKSLLSVLAKSRNTSASRQVTEV